MPYIVTYRILKQLQIPNLIDNKEIDNCPTDTKIKILDMHIFKSYGAFITKSGYISMNIDMHISDINQESKYIARIIFNRTHLCIEDKTNYNKLNDSGNLEEYVELVAKHIATILMKNYNTILDIFNKTEKELSDVMSKYPKVYYKNTFDNFIVQMKYYYDITDTDYTILEIS